jgi:hypothetical protein
MNEKAKDLELKAKAIRRNQKLLKKRQKIKSVVPKIVTNKFIIHARARRPIIREDKTLVEAIKWVLDQIPKDDLFEVHDADDNIIWGRSTGLNKKNYKDTYGRACK